MASVNTAFITNVASGECIPFNFDVEVSYTNAATTPAGVVRTVSLDCGAAAPIADQSAPGSNGIRTFGVSHTASGTNHTISTDLKHDGVRVGGDSVSPVEISNNCPVSVDETAPTDGGLPGVDPTKPLSGMYDPHKGNRVELQVEELKFVNGQLQRRLIYADRAEVNAGVPPNHGTWGHGVIQVAHAGHHLRVILTKDGVVKAIIRALFVGKKD
jgi:hypothetical protein